MALAPEREATSSITGLLAATRRGDPAASDKLFRRVYRELKVVASALRKGGPATMAPTELVHEAILRLESRNNNDWGENRRHFFFLLERAMRDVLIDLARKRQAHKRGGLRRLVPLLDDTRSVDASAESFLDISDAIAALKEHDPQAAEVVGLRFYVGLTLAVIAETLGRPLISVRRDWEYARAWLRAYLGGERV